MNVQSRLSIGALVAAALLGSATFASAAPRLPEPAAVRGAAMLHQTKATPPKKAKVEVKKTAKAKKAVARTHKQKVVKVAARKSCGTFNYYSRKDRKCVDARVKPAK